MADARVLVVDHYDSYTWNLVHLVAGVTGRLPDVAEHDRTGLRDELADYSHLVPLTRPRSPGRPLRLRART